MLRSAEMVLQTRMIMRWHARARESPSHDHHDDVTSAVNNVHHSLDAISAELNQMNG